MKNQGRHIFIYIDHLSLEAFSCFLTNIESRNSIVRLFGSVTDELGDLAWALKLFSTPVCFVITIITITIPLHSAVVSPENCVSCSSLWVISIISNTIFICNENLIDIIDFINITDDTEHYGYLMSLLFRLTSEINLFPLPHQYEQTVKLQSWPFLLLSLHSLKGHSEWSLIIIPWSI